MDINIAMENLRKRGFDVSYFETKEAAAGYLDSKIDGKSVAFGGSMTLKEMHMFSRLKTHNDMRDRTEFASQQEALMHDLEVQVYMTSANGISEDGKIVNIDGCGNRVAATLFGREEVYFVVGVNKFADTLDDAMYRARNIASPKNAQRLGRKTPCAVRADKCYDCNSPERICRGFVIMEKAMRNDCRYEIVVINEELGY